MKEYEYQQTDQELKNSLEFFNQVMKDPDEHEVVFVNPYFSNITFDIGRPHLTVDQLSNGKRLDSYNPIKGEIVSRKATDLESIDVSTFEGYLKELKNKYPAGTTIRSNKYPDLDGQPLTGKQILEIPASNKKFDEIQTYVNLAKNKYDIEIRFREE